jgi:hypothetical protein
VSKKTGESFSQKCYSLPSGSETLANQKEKTNWKIQIVFRGSSLAKGATDNWENQQIRVPVPDICESAPERWSGSLSSNPGGPPRVPRPG